jgi:glutamate transport system permease protein
MSRASALFDAPGPRARVRNRAISTGTVLLAAFAIWVIYSRLEAKGQLDPDKWAPFLSANLWKTYVLPGVRGTLTAAALSIALALATGVILGVGRLSTVSALRWVCAALVEFFRTTPVLVMMIFAYFVYALYDVVPGRLLALAGVVTGLTLYNGAVIAEIVRAGVHALPRGQSEAAAALGMRWNQTMRLVLLPQAVTAMLPVLVSQLVVVLKDTAIGYQITLVEMVRQGTMVGAQYSNFVPALIVIATLMITVNMGLSQLAFSIEQRLRRSRRTPLEAATIEQEGAPGAAVAQAH